MGETVDTIVQCFNKHGISTTVAPENAVSNELGMPAKGSVASGAASIVTAWGQKANKSATDVETPRIGQSMIRVTIKSCDAVG